MRRQRYLVYISTFVIVLALAALPLGFTLVDTTYATPHPHEGGEEEPEAEPEEPAPQPTPQPPAPVIAETLDLTSDAIVVDGTAVVQATSSSGIVAVTVPVAAVTGTQTVEVRVDSVLQAELGTDIPGGTVLVDGEAIDININDDGGDPITQFAQDIMCSWKLDLQTTDPETLAVAAFDETLDPPQWVQIPATIEADGTVAWSVDHLTLFAILKMSTVTHLLAGGLNSITFTGASGTFAADIASEIGASLETLLRFDAPSQSWLTFLPAAPAQVNTLKTLNQRDALILRVTPGAEVRWTDTDIIPDPSGARTVVLVPGLNSIGFTGADATDIAELLKPVADSVESAARFDTQTQTWLTFLPAAPPAVNTLRELNRLDVVYIRVRGAFRALEFPDTAPGG